MKLQPLQFLVLSVIIGSGTTALAESHTSANSPASHSSSNNDSIPPKPAKDFRQLALQTDKLTTAFDQIFSDKHAHYSAIMVMFDDNLRAKSKTLKTLHVRTLSDLDTIIGNRLTTLRKEWLLLDQQTIKKMAPLINAKEAKQLGYVLDIARERLIAPKEGVKS
ncbi:Uncharacterised protein [BD1-7 clade bacterium]|uniref:Uncharacterized protein n=1 Tax=BD1-7 clade bacterium TaxID=2029982 RepID=A0A5S9NL64_9GAMM|nr:Uncharacterised protein [BD1-7 clade bacterium]CAA0093515.1 Uncharacterised protein [BD1-7 clade bacterium]